MKQIIILIGTLLIFFGIGQAQTPFSGCNPSFYQVIAGQLYLLDANTEPATYTDVQANNLGSYNATGYNPVDRLIYGMLGNENLLVIGEDGVAVDLGPITGLPSISGNYFVGDFDLNGNYYIIRGSNLFRIDVNTIQATPVPVTGDAGGIADFAYYDPDNDASNGFSFIGVRSGGDQIVKIDIDGTGSTATATRIDLTGIGNPNINNENNQGFGAAYTTNGGTKLYFSNNFTGNFYQVNIDEGVSPAQAYAVYISTAQQTNNNDGASCALADAPFPCGINVLLLETNCLSSSTYDLIASISFVSPTSATFTVDVNNGEVIQTFTYAAVPAPPNNQVVISGLSILGNDIPVRIYDDIDDDECSGSDTYDSPECCPVNAGMLLTDCGVFCIDGTTSESPSGTTFDVMVDFEGELPPAAYEYAFFVSDGTNILSVQPSGIYASGSPANFTEAVAVGDLPPGDYNIYGFNYDPADPDFSGLPLPGTALSSFTPNLDEIDNMSNFAQICADISIIRGAQFSVIDPAAVSVFAGQDTSFCSIRKLVLSDLQPNIPGGYDAFWASDSGGMFLAADGVTETNAFDEAVFFMLSSTSPPETLTLTLNLDICPASNCPIITDEVAIEIRNVGCGNFPWDGN